MSVGSFRFHPSAREELDAAAERYDTKLPGLSLELLDAVQDALELILERPEAWQNETSVGPAPQVSASAADNHAAALALSHFAD